jgi:hypothetical protein
MAPHQISACHHRPCAGDPDCGSAVLFRIVMAGTSPAMTKGGGNAQTKSRAFGDGAKVKGDAGELRVLVPRGSNL